MNLAQLLFHSTTDLEARIIAALRTVHDPEIPLNIYDLGLIYDLSIDDEKVVRIAMTLTAPACPAAHTFPEQVEAAVRSVDGVADAVVELVWEPAWSPARMSEAARLQLGIY
jgi:FeS assembly SUF system protein